MIRANPFTSKTFVSCWSKYFLADKKTHSFDFLNGVLFYESKLPGLNINVGKNLTKGISYQLETTKHSNVQGKTLLIYDVIGSPKKKTLLDDKGIGLHTVRQYPGFMIHLGEFTSLDDFMSKTFKKSSRYKLRKYKRRLEESFDISFKVYHGAISKEEYDATFDRFRHLLEKRFAEKEIYNNNLDADEWGFYKEVAYPMILEEKAALFVLYSGKEAISITLGYLSENRVFDAITVFDIDYAKFHLGSVKIMYLIGWCLNNGWQILDFSKGYFDYKTRWSNQQFDFHYHILYDKKSMKSRSLSFILKYFFELKLYLRERKINESLHRMRYALKNKKDQGVQYSFMEWNDGHTKEDINPLDINAANFTFLKSICYDFLYLYQEHVRNLNVYKVGKTENFFLLTGQNAKVGLEITS